jgi:RNA polymerase sigma factor (sigma-70 family)
MDEGNQELARLLGRVALRDQAAFRALYEATSAHLLGLAYGILQRRDHAEDVLQEAFMNVWNGADGYTPTLATPMTWLINIVRNKAIDKSLTHLVPVLAACLMAAASLNPAHASDAAPIQTAAAAAADPLSSARALIADNKWTAAIAELQRINVPQSADWNSLMGYSHRKAKSPDYEASERYYDVALALNPRHRGALEYSGELFLMLGDLPRAEQRLAALDRECLLPCGEYTELKNAVAKFKAKGGHAAALN